jgi:hypothetical protein
MAALEVRGSRGEMKATLAETAQRYLVARNLLPEAHFRLAALGCLVGAGCSAIYLVDHPGSQSVLFAHLRDLQVYLALAFCLFVLFYVEHYFVRQYTTCKLEARMVSWQSLGSSALILAGAWGILWPVQIAAFSDRMLIAAAVLGEFVFVWNVIRAFTRDEVAGIFPSAGARRKAARGADNFGWPKSPVKQFGIAAALFAAGGLASVVLNVPSFQIPVPIQGQLHLVRFGWLSVAAAIPFALYAQLYKVLIDTCHIEFDDSLNRWHFAVTIIGVILVVMQWEQSVLFRLTALPETKPLAEVAGLSATLFAINIYRGYRPRRSSRRNYQGSKQS